MQRFDESNFHKLCDELSAKHPDLAAIIKEHNYPPMWTRANTFETLVHIILEQQVSLASALAALNKLRERLGVISPDAFLVLTDEELKSCYFSRQKTIYTRGLANELVSGKLDLSSFEQMSDQDVRTRLVQLKGIGNWTVDVYLMFVLQRTDVFPVGDIAAVNALKRIKNLGKETDREEVLRVAALWEPYRSIATMILWHHYLSAPIKKVKVK